MKCWQLVARVGLWLTLLAPAAHAQQVSDCSGERPWVSLAGNLRKAVVHAVASELRAGLAPSHIDVCELGDKTAGEPLARVSITQEGEQARFSLDVTDSVTQKRVGRDLSLDKLPADGRALALAVAAEELLRASWAELALRGVHRPDTAPPPEVRAVVERAAPAPTPRRFTAIGPRLAFEHFTGGQTHYGGDVFLALPFGARAGVMGAVGARRALSEQAPHGSIGARAFSGELGLSLSLLRPSAFELGAFVSARVLWLRYEASATGGVAAGADASSASGTAVVSRGGLVLAFGRRGVVRSYSTLGVGLPLRAFSASDSGTTVTGASGLELFAGAALALEL
ncbi:MAG TPA: hypothetical protein VHB79_19210 [Polyangiaceae bacterium]|nr:hypothetical protein [Polyangiaceae bacterium]